MKRKNLLLASIGAMVASVLGGCILDDDNGGSPASLRILHINDHHSRLQPTTGDSLILDGRATTVQTGGFPSVTSKINELSAGRSSVLKLHAGDAITGELYYTLFKGKADAEQMNQVCFDAFALGNHEFDDGDAGLKSFLDHLRSGTCKTEVLSANLQLRVGTSPLAQTSATQYVKPYTVKEIDGQRYGIIGITIGAKTKNSSSPDPTTTFADETSTVQRYIDELTAQGIDKVILLTHQGYSADLAMAARLRGVDVIVGGDSPTLLGDGFKAFGLSPTGPYPTKATNADGKQVCVVQANEYAKVVGQLDVQFDRFGDVTACTGTPHMLLGNVFRRTVSGTATDLAGAERDAVVKAVNDAPELSIVTPDSRAQANLDSFRSQVDSLRQTVIGTAAEDLCLERVPGQGNNGGVAGCAQATRSRGSDISNIVAKAFLEMSKTSDICIQNGGGVRITVPAGNITIGTAYNLLPFANTLTEIEMTGQEIINVLEDAMDAALNGIPPSTTANTGSYPYAAGLRWHVDMSKLKGSRLSNVEVNPRARGSWTPIDRNRTYKVVTNNFLARGQDGYTTFANIPASRKTDTFLDYAQAFVDYVRRETAAGRPITKLPIAEYSTQQFINRSGELQ